MQLGQVNYLQAIQLFQASGLKGNSSDGLSISNDIAARYGLDIGDPVKVFFADQEIDTYIQNTRVG